jgi:hypothetical protein
VAFLDSNRVGRAWYCPCCGDTENLSNLWKFDQSTQDEMDGNYEFWQAIKKGKDMIEQEKKMITERHGEGQVSLDADIEHFKGKLEKARLDGNDEEARKIEKQISLLEDAVVVYRINRTPDRRVFEVDLGGLPPEEAKLAMDRITYELEKKQLNG